MKPGAYRIPDTVDVVPLYELLQPCTRWAYVWFALAAATRRAGRWDLAERMTSAGDDALEALEVIHCGY